ncbi:hypothetical protein [Plantactinospora soyae]|uniref:FAD/FMN-containing dehydrogenase n=1 Tax=Plantactinospora soyae TaxID=1544732 RepID=A0A927MAR4_9ACTN|nr:hypothetical protein [Plantactinospora soyae]MBE1489731.1 FAD/FMN-containing dehydrogenase [Plantactinospora soyae]
MQALGAHCRDHHLTLSVLGGGYGWAGRTLCPCGLVIDMSRTRQVTVRAGSDGDARRPGR